MAFGLGKFLKARCSFDVDIDHNGGQQLWMYRTGQDRWSKTFLEGNSFRIDVEAYDQERVRCTHPGYVNPVQGNAPEPDVADADVAEPTVVDFPTGGFELDGAFVPIEGERSHHWARDRIDSHATALHRVEFFLMVPEAGRALPHRGEGVPCGRRRDKVPKDTVFFVGLGAPHGPGRVECEFHSFTRCFPTPWCHHCQAAGMAWEDAGVGVVVSDEGGRHISQAALNKNNRKCEHCGLHVTLHRQLSNTVVCSTLAVQGHPWRHWSCQRDPNTDHGYMLWTMLVRSQFCKRFKPEKF